MLLGTCDHAGHDFAFRRTDLQQPCFLEQTLAAPFGQFGPRLIGPQQERSVVRMFEVGLTDDSRGAVGAAPVVARGKRSIPSARTPRFARW